jgi:hypothetical protein
MSDDVTVEPLPGDPLRMYLLLYSGGGMPETEQDTNAMTDAWGAWLAGIGSALVDGNPFTPNAKSLSPDGAVSDGPVGPVVSGYSLIKARTMDEAVEMAKDCPAKLSGATISIFEVM